MNRSDNRSFDGRNNNLKQPTLGAAQTPLLRKAPAAYADGVSKPARRGRADRTNPRVISNFLCRQDTPLPNRRGLTDFVWAWGQFLDHELDLTGPASPAEPAPIAVQAGDPRLPNGGEIPFHRSEYDSATGAGKRNPRQQINQLPSYIDATNVYGNSETRAAVLRAHDGTGRLRVTHTVHGDLLPLNVRELPNAQAPDNRPRSAFFLAGDIRANEHAVLVAMHTLFVREHNRLCLESIRQMPSLLGEDEVLYQRARKRVGAQMQVITFSEFLPALLGGGIVRPYEGYQQDIDPSISNEFATAAYRLGHSMLSSHLRLGHGAERVALRDAFFDPSLIFAHGIDPFLCGLPLNVMQEVDLRIVDDVREFLFTPPHTDDVLLDLAALNIQRGRDHGLADYNTCRETFGLARIHAFDDITRDAVTRDKLQHIYGDVDSIDPWIGALAEDHLDDASVGPLICAVLKDQFERCRDGDRFWYENDAAFENEEIEQLSSTRLSDIIRRNTAIEDIPDNAFQRDTGCRPRRAA